MERIKTLLERLQACATTNNPAPLDECLLELEIQLVEFDEWPSSLFDGLTSLLDNDAFLVLANSWKVLNLFENNWQLLSAQQRGRLRRLLVASFGKYADWMAAFVAAEMLGGRFADAAGLEALEQLAHGSPVAARALVPHGLETFARSTDDKQLRERAVDDLRKLAVSGSDEVKREAEISLQKVRRSLKNREEPPL